MNDYLAIKEVNNKEFPGTIVYKTKEQKILSLKIGSAESLASSLVGGPNVVEITFSDPNGYQQHLWSAAFTRGYGSDVHNINGRHYIFDTKTLNVWESTSEEPAPWNLFGKHIIVNGKDRRVENWLDIVKARPENYRKLPVFIAYNVNVQYDEKENYKPLPLQTMPYAKVLIPERRHDEATEIIKKVHSDRSDFIESIVKTDKYPYIRKPGIYSAIEKMMINQEESNLMKIEDELYLRIAIYENEKNLHSSSDVTKYNASKADEVMTELLRILTSSSTDA